jgi:hypothetical protein
MPQPVNEISIVGPSPCGLSTAGLRCNNLTGYSYVYVNGYYYDSDGGGGYFVEGPCNGNTDNGGTVLVDNQGNCFYRASTNWNIREWGANCNVVVPNSTLKFTPNGSNPATLATSPQVPDNFPSGDQPIVVIPGLGGGTYSVMGQQAPPMGGGLATMSYLSSNGSGYSSGQIVTFPASGGTETQLVQIIVDK